ncbi:hypothetical protein [Streptomyces albidochromogenes]|uniref:Integrase n=1 Tax=Streptomyces albidochromogenes TaxID=329524 RepID=A0ABW6FFW1_9ACTN
MPSLLSNRLTKWALRPVAVLVDQRISRHTAGLRREVTELRRKQHGLTLLLDRTGRGQHRMPTPDQIDRLVKEVEATTGAGARARRNVTVAYRNVVALEAQRPPSGRSDVPHPLVAVERAAHLGRQRVVRAVRALGVVQQAL